MTRDALIEALAKNLFEWNTEEGEWVSLPDGVKQNYRAVIAYGPLRLFVEFVAEWMENDISASGYQMSLRWRKEMGA